VRFAELGVSRLVGLVLFCAGLAFPARAGAKADPKCEEVLQAAHVPGALDGLRSIYCQTKVELSVLTQYYAV
jgi:hypothetical protein